MKKISMILLIGILLIMNSIVAQTLVVWSAKVGVSDLATYNAHMEKYWNPIVDEFVEKGDLDAFTYLNHAWGDEWSVIIHYEAKNFSEFQKVWSATLKEYRKITPEEESEKIWPMVQDHKDNILTVRHSKRK